ncbi:MAG: mechanosensitive ion channel [Bacteroidia bacterium]|nr:mechanosensitive ion channel [Bacteroidia bacterium]MDW8157875.1 mechanosensitive ion channel [Bacteroidia bacterium]
MKTQRVPLGRAYAVTQIAKYLIYALLLIIGLQSTGVNVTVLVASSTALLVGVGLGLQTIFNDFFSGLILLFEGNLQVDDVVQVENLIGRVTEVGFRTSKIITRDGVSIIVPNSRFISNSLVNWSHENPISRFYISVGVAYDSDVEKVKQILLSCALAHESVEKEPAPQVFFEDYADFSLIFRLHFWTNDVFNVETTKSELRYAIWHALKANQITIPFPQREIKIISS